MSRVQFEIPVPAVSTGVVVTVEDAREEVLQTKKFLSCDGKKPLVCVLPQGVNSLDEVIVRVAFNGTEQFLVDGRLVSSAPVPFAAEAVVDCDQPEDECCGDPENCDHDGEETKDEACCDSEAGRGREEPEGDASACCTESVQVSDDAAVESDTPEKWSVSSDEVGSLDDVLGASDEDGDYSL